MDNLISAFNWVLSTLEGLLWTHLLVYLLVGTGFYFTVRLGFIQLRRLGHAVTVLKSGTDLASGISSWQVFCTSMAARVGTGNMAGVAVAITTGGPGAIFWMWAIALLGMATAFVESTLAQLYKEKDDNGQYRGGPAYYMEKGLGLRWMGSLFSVFLIIAFGLVFNAVQANTITDALSHSFGMNEWVLGVILVITSGLCIMGGIKRVAQASSKIVPVMALGYLAISLVVVLMNLSRLPEVLQLIINSAFGWHEAAAGGLGFTVAQAMRAGIARGLFSNEAGMGSAANIAASATPTPNHPASQGFVQMLGVFADTIIICTASAAIVLVSGVLDAATVPEGGIAIVQTALTNEMGNWASYFIAVAIILFCFSSIIANYSYAETNIMFLTDNKRSLPIFRLAVMAMVMFGSVAKIKVVWQMADVSMGLMATINIIAMLALSGLAIRVIKDYEEQYKAGKTPIFDPNKFPELDELETWHEELAKEKAAKKAAAMAR
uniref:alanine/glycine:cation symporter family protein n=1 Tax=Thaumasiovibrio occultus TaxID=1891184 RepID=UPI000B34AFDA|nr:alanine/glycine:cation symporter family protein [Thaumasiovibrio occultus]